MIQNFLKIQLHLWTTRLYLPWLNHGISPNTGIKVWKLKICSQVGSEVNINIEPTGYVIFAWGSGAPGYHGVNRGSRSLPLLSALNGQASKIEMNEVTTADFNVTVRTQIFKFWNLDESN